MDKVIKSIEEVRKDRDIFVVGCSNTGKSTFVTQLMQVPCRIFPEIYFSSIIVILSILIALQ
jgi:polynucleotide 5'-kinase involved in rRNA processing